ncbi:hypothetical protein JCM10914A_50100 [Paenibacillus sp. JCM 10914]|nr:hypothetical protein JCM10914_4647 [Paenibacillus sp. JCM 10914]
MAKSTYLVSHPSVKILFHIRMTIVQNPDVYVNTVTETIAILTLNSFQARGGN